MKFINFNFNSNHTIDCKKAFNKYLFVTIVPNQDPPKLPSGQSLIPTYY